MICHRIDRHDGSRGAEAVVSIAIPQPDGVPDALDLIRSSDDRVMANAARGQRTIRGRRKTTERTRRAKLDAGSRPAAGNLTRPAMARFAQSAPT